MDDEVDEEEATRQDMHAWPHASGTMLIQGTRSKVLKRRVLRNILPNGDS